MITIPDLKAMPDPDAVYTFGDITLKNGDRLDMTFKFRGPVFVRALYLYEIEQRIAKTEFVAIESYTWLDRGVMMRCKIIDVVAIAALEPDRAGVGAIAVIALSVAILGSALVWYFTCDDVQKVFDTPVAKATSLGLLAVGLAVLLWVWNRRG